MIGVFDSGVGGLSVMAEIRRLLPESDLIYLADHAWGPYGTRSLEQVRARSGTVADWMIAQGCEVVTIACNTASAAALHHLRAVHPEVAFVGMEPAMKPAATASRSRRVGVVATRATFQGELFASVVDRFARGVRVVTAACPRWVEMVEQGLTEGEEVTKEVRRCLEPMIESGVDVLVLACTHYPALRATIAAVLGPGVHLIDPAPAVARQTARKAGKRHGIGGSRTALYSTADPDALARAAGRLGVDGSVALLPLP